MRIYTITSQNINIKYQIITTAVWNLYNPTLVGIGKLIMSDYAIQFVWEYANCINHCRIIEVSELHR